MNLDDELRAALQRRDPSPDFTNRVLARVAAQSVRPASRTGSHKWTPWVAALAASLMLTAGALEYRRYQGERAKAQVLYALRITATKLNKAQKKVQMITHRSNS